MRLLALCLIAILAAGCDPFAKLPDGEQIDSIWVGAEADCESVDPGFCAALFTCAVEAEFGGAHHSIVSWQMHAPPDRLRDGTLVTTGAPSRSSFSIWLTELAMPPRSPRRIAAAERCGRPPRA